MGLDYGACLPVIDRLLQRWRSEDEPLIQDMRDAELFDDIQAIEAGVLSAQAERLEQQRRTQQQPRGDA